MHLSEEVSQSNYASLPGKETSATRLDLGGRGEGPQTARVCDLQWSRTYSTIRGKNDMRRTRMEHVPERGGKPNQSEHRRGTSELGASLPELATACHQRQDGANNG